MTISTKVHNINIEAGADFFLPFTVRDDSDVLVDLTGAIVTGQIREYAEAPDYIQFTAVHNGAGGHVKLSLAHEDTASIGFMDGVYDVFIDFPDTTRLKYLEGAVDVTPAVTKPVNGDIMYVLSFDSENYFPSVGLVRRLYLSHASSKLYRWNGTGYVTLDQGGYTREEIDALLLEKSDISHNHDDRYYTESEVDTLLTGKSDTGHTHDDRYYTDTETDSLLAGKADNEHTHSYNDITDTPQFGALAFEDSIDYETDISNLPTLGALADHDTVDYETEIDNLPSLGGLAEKDSVDWDTDIVNIPSYFTPEAHDHDDRYYTENEVDTALSGKSDTGHTHTMSDVTDLPTFGDLAEKDTVDWDTDIDDIPSTFPPSSHTHTTSDITDFPTLGTMSAEDTSDYYNKSATDALLQDKADIILSSASGSIASFSDGGAYPVTALTVGIEPVQSGSGTPSPDNIRPISGHTSATVYEAPTTATFVQGGIGDTSGSEVSVNTRIRTGYIPISALNKASNTIAIYGKNYASGTPILRQVHFYNSSNTWISRYPTDVNIEQQSVTIPSTAIPSNAAFIRIVGQYNLAGTTAITPDGILCYINGTSVTIDLNGTRYGGSINVLTGEMVVTHGIVDLGTLTWSNTSVTNMFASTSLQNVIKYPATSVKFDGISSALKIETGNHVYDKISTNIIGTNGNGGIWVFLDTSYTDYTAVTSALSGVKLVYPLATPITVQLTPSTTLETLKGENHIWSSTGDTSVTYRADTKLYVYGKADVDSALSRKAEKTFIAGYETTTKASQNYTSGSLVVVVNKFVKLTSNVSSGSTITVGTNATETTIAAELALKANSSALGGMASVNDAPSDSAYYVRQNGSWVTLPIYSGGVS